MGNTQHAISTFERYLEEIRNGKTSFEVDSIERHIERYMNDLGESPELKLREAIVEGVRLNIERLKNGEDWHRYTIKTIIERYKLTEEKKLYEDASKICSENHVRKVIEILKKNDWHDYYEHMYFSPENIESGLKKEFEEALQVCGEVSGAKEHYDTDKIVKKYGVRNWYKDNKTGLLTLSITIPCFLEGRWEAEVCRRVAKKHGIPDIRHYEYSAEDGGYSESYYYFNFETSPKDLEENCKKANEIPKEMSERIEKVKMKFADMAFE